MGKDGFNDGMNEKGLSIGFLWMPGTKYQTINAGEENSAIEILDFGHWLLSNFATADEIRSALSSVRVWGAENPLLKAIPPLHVAVHDAGGKNLVIQFLHGEMQLHDNPIGVLTNYTSFDWQITNLGNYANLTPFDTKPLSLDGSNIFPTGHGSGLHGLPGDMTPPSRFVRTVYFKQSALPAANTTEAINLAEHLLNAVDIPKGANIISKKSTEGDYTQWAVIKDLTHRVLYFRTYENIALRKIDLNKIDLTPGSPTKSIPLSGSF
jgi:choloylglycine hydrolase